MQLLATRCVQVSNGLSSKQNRSSQLQQDHPDFLHSSIILRTGYYLMYPYPVSACVYSYQAADCCDFDCFLLLLLLLLIII